MRLSVSLPLFASHYLLDVWDYRPPREPTEAFPDLLVLISEVGITGVFLGFLSLTSLD